MNDWADEVVKTLVTGHQIAAALRKAKADGMRECADAINRQADILPHVAEALGADEREVTAVGKVLKVMEREFRERAARVEQPR